MGKKRPTKADLEARERMVRNAENLRRIVEENEARRAEARKEAEKPS